MTPFLILRSISNRATVLIASTLLLAACGSGPSTAAGNPASAGHALSWVDQPVSFSAGGLTVYATFRHPVGARGAVPGALLIAGSGPTDRNGNSPLESGTVDTLKTLADWLSSDGVASIRYDKLGSGETGLGPFATNLDAIGIALYEQETLAALRFLVAQKGINDGSIAVFGHSEGALFALLLATGHAGDAPPIHALGLIEPLSLRYLDVITAQVQAQVAGQLASGEITAAVADQVDGTLASAVTQLRQTGQVPANLPYGLSGILSPSTALFLYQADQFDPAALAASLPKGTPVLVSCSDADVQVSCGQVEHLVGGLTSARAAIDFLHLSGVDHVLKEDPSGSASDYTKPLPFSSELKHSLQSFMLHSLS